MQGFTAIGNTINYNGGGGRPPPAPIVITSTINANIAGTQCLNNSKPISCPTGAEALW